MYGEPQQNAGPAMPRTGQVRTWGRSRWRGALPRARGARFGDCVYCPRLSFPSSGSELLERPGGLSVSSRLSQAASDGTDAAKHQAHPSGPPKPGDPPEKAQPSGDVSQSVC